MLLVPASTVPIPRTAVPLLQCFPNPTAHAQSFPSCPDTFPSSLPSRSITPQHSCAIFCRFLQCPGEPQGGCANGRQPACVTQDVGSELMQAGDFFFQQRLTASRCFNPFLALPEVKVSAV
uniref:Uncharacterized protein n=1 Tax=Arundo donax TaxID=35708 RepID=A0A0A8YYJ7_ARUDO